MAANPFPHLPPGHEPGAQSLRNRAQSSFWSPVSAVVGTAMFAAGVWAAAGGRGSRFDAQEELLGGIIFALGGLLCIYGAGVMRGKGRPKRHPRMRGTSLTVDRESPRRGEEVSITFAGRRERDDSLEVGLVCVERYDVQVRIYVRGASTVRRETGEARVHEQWQAVPPAVREQTYTFVIPSDAPYSYEGDCVSYAWLVSGRAVKRLRQDLRLEEPIWVRP